MKKKKKERDGIISGVWGEGEGKICTLKQWIGVWSMREENKNWRVKEWKGVGW